MGGYRMAGIPDGLGAYDNGNGTFTVLMNHEFPSTSGVAHGPLSKGAFVSNWVIDKSTLQVVSGGDLIRNVYGWNASTQSSYASATSDWSFNRFCSADLPQLSAFYNPSSGLGTQSRLFLNGEEGGATGYAIATVANMGNAYIRENCGQIPILSFNVITVQKQISHGGFGSSGIYGLAET